MRYLLTGATGFLGRELLARMLLRGNDVLVLSRRKGEESLADAKTRIAELVAKTGSGAPIEKLTVTFGDVTEPRLGLQEDARAWIERGDRVPIRIVHGAAEVRFDLPYAVMHKQNVEGVNHMLALAAELHTKRLLDRVDHVSTSFIAGARTGVALETELDVGQKPRNDYERTKLEAEQSIARARTEGLPICVHRPSIIVGDSRTGRASSFKVLYWPLKVYARGRWRTLFGRPSCAIDVVPVDFVADAMMHLFDQSEALGKTFHLAAGLDRQSTIAELIALAEKEFARGRVRYVDPDLYMRWLRPIVRPILALLRPDVAERGGVYLPYFRSNPSFSTAEAAKLLEPAGIIPPRVQEYFGAILRYARESDFGKKEPLLLPAATSPPSRRTGS